MLLYIYLYTSAAARHHLLEVDSKEFVCYVSFLFLIFLNLHKHTTNLSVSEQTLEPTDGCFALLLVASKDFRNEAQMWCNEWNNMWLLDIPYLRHVWIFTPGGIWNASTHTHTRVCPYLRTDFNFFFFPFFCNLTQTFPVTLTTNPDLKLISVQTFHLNCDLKAGNRPKFVHFVLRKKRKKKFK